MSTTRNLGTIYMGLSMTPEAQTVLGQWLQKNKYILKDTEVDFTSRFKTANGELISYTFSTDHTIFTRPKYHHPSELRCEVVSNSEALGVGIYGMVFPIKATMRLRLDSSLEYKVFTKRAVKMEKLEYGDLGNGVVITEERAFNNERNFWLKVVKLATHLHSKDPVLFGGYVHTVMHFFSGESLHDYHLKKHPTIQNLFLLFNLFYAWDMQINSPRLFHLDLKPDNIMVLEEPSDAVGVYTQPTIIDMSHSVPQSDLSLAGITGTAQFGAPEQLLGKTLRAKTDLYALGRIFATVLGLINEVTEHQDKDKYTREAAKKDATRPVTYRIPQNALQEITDEDKKIILMIATRLNCLDPKDRLEYTTVITLFRSLVFGAFASSLMARHSNVNFASYEVVEAFNGGVRARSNLAELNKRFPHAMLSDFSHLRDFFVKNIAQIKDNKYALHAYVSALGIPALGMPNSHQELLTIINNIIAALRLALEKKALKEMLAALPSQHAAAVYDPNIFSMNRRELNPDFLNLEAGYLIQDLKVYLANTHHFSLSLNDAVLVANKIKLRTETFSARYQIYLLRAARIAINDIYSRLYAHLRSSPLVASDFPIKIVKQSSLMGSLLVEWEAENLSLEEKNALGVKAQTLLKEYQGLKEQVAYYLTKEVHYYLCQLRILEKEIKAFKNLVDFSNEVEQLQSFVTELQRYYQDHCHERQPISRGFLNCLDAFKHRLALGQDLVLKMRHKLCAKFQAVENKSDQSRQPPAIKLTDVINLLRQSNQAVPFEMTPVHHRLNLLRDQLRTTLDAYLLKTAQHTGLFGYLYRQVLPEQRLQLIYDLAKCINNETQDADRLIQQVEDRFKGADAPELYGALKSTLQEFKADAEMLTSSKRY